MSDNETNDENKNQAKLNTSRVLVFNSTNELDLVSLSLLITMNYNYRRNSI